MLLFYFISKYCPIKLGFQTTEFHLKSIFCPERMSFIQQRQKRVEMYIFKQFKSPTRAFNEPRFGRGASAIVVSLFFHSSSSSSTPTSVDTEDEYDDGVLIRIMNITITMMSMIKMQNNDGILNDMMLLTIPPLLKMNVLRTLACRGMIDTANTRSAITFISIPAQQRSRPSTDDNAVFIPLYYPLLQNTLLYCHHRYCLLSAVSVTDIDLHSSVVERTASYEIEKANRLTDNVTQEGNREI